MRLISRRTFFFFFDIDQPLPHRPEHVPLLLGIGFLKAFYAESRRIVQQGVQHPLEAVRVSGVFPALRFGIVVREVQPRLRKFSGYVVKYRNSRSFDRRDRVAKDCYKRLLELWADFVYNVIVKKGV